MESLFDQCAKIEKKTETTNNIVNFTNAIVHLKSR